MAVVAFCVFEVFVERNEWKWGCFCGVEEGVESVERWLIVGFLYIKVFHELDISIDRIDERMTGDTPSNPCYLHT